MNGRTIAEEFAGILRRALGERCRAIALFGSWARNNARSDSDIDLLLIADGLADDPFQRNAQVRGPVYRRLEPVSILARTPSEFEADVTPLHLDLALDAVVLFEDRNYLSSRLAIVRRRIEEAGLVRVADLSWRWRKLPSVANWAVHWDGVRV